MKRTAGLLAAVGLLFLPLTAGATGPYDKATGSGERPGPPFAPRKVSFSAHNGPNGPSGHAVSQSPGPFFNFHGHVTCLLVEGNRAVVGSVLDKAENPDFVGRTWMFAVEDNGNPSGATPDRLSLYFIAPPDELDPEDCTVGTALYDTLAPITSGNLSVSDAP